MKYLAALCAFSLLASPLFSQNISVKNPGFESQSPFRGTYNTFITHWQSTAEVGKRGVFNPAPDSFNPFFSGNCAFVNQGELYQELDHKLIPNTVYTLGVDVGRRYAGEFPGFKLQLTAGDTVLAQFESDDDTFIEPGEFRWFETQFKTGNEGDDDEIPDALKKENLVIRLVSNGTVTYFDNINLTIYNRERDRCSQLSSVIGSPVTLRVPQHYATVNEALACLSGSRILAPVTIKLEDGDNLPSPDLYTEYNTISLSHPDAANIRIVGNVLHPEKVRLEFKAQPFQTTGIAVSSGNQVSVIDGLTLVGPNNGTGVKLGSEARGNLGSSLIIQNFDTGVSLSRKSELTAYGVTLKDNGVGIYASHYALIDASRAVFSSNHAAGVSLDYECSAILEGAHFANNGVGVSVLGASTAHLSHAEFTDNGQDKEHGEHDRILE